MTDNPDHAAAPQRSSPRQVILGLFILGQLAFLVLSNALAFYQEPREYLPAEVAAAVDRVLPGYTHKSGQAWTLPDETATLVRRWSQLTAQDQRWSLFAPGVFKVTGFPALVLVNEDDSAPALARTFDLMNRAAEGRTDGADSLQTLRSADLEPPALRAAGQVVAPLAACAPLGAAVLTGATLEPSITAVPLDVDLFLSDNEPADRRHFARLGKFRLRRFESYLIPYLKQGEGETLAEARLRWAGKIRDRVNDSADAIFFYLQWRLAAYRARYPERGSPKQVILVERVFVILPPGDDAGECWQGPRTLPLARWRPEADLPKDCRPIERYNPATARFETVLK